MVKNEMYDFVYKENGDLNSLVLMLLMSFFTLILSTSRTRGPN